MSRFIRRQHAARFLQGVSEQPDVACRNPGECSVTAGIGHHDHSFIQDFAIPEQEFVSESAEPGQAEFSDDSEEPEEKFDRRSDSTNRSEQEFDGDSAEIGHEFDSDSAELEQEFDSDLAESEQEFDGYVINSAESEQEVDIDSAEMAGLMEHSDTVTEEDIHIRIPTSEIETNNEEDWLHVSHLVGDGQYWHFNPSIYEESEIARKCLYEGAGLTVLQAVCQHMSWFTSHPGISKEAVSDSLHMQHHVLLPQGNLLPESFELARKTIEPFLLQPVVFHACQNDCILFNKEFETLKECPKCNAPRYKHGTIPFRKFVYLPIGPRLERLFGTSNLAQLVQSHSGSDFEVPDVMHDIHDSPVWKFAYSKLGIFNNDKRGISLGLCTDGVSPFSHHKVTYSMWPIMITLLNLPRKMRCLFQNILLLGIIPANGTKEPHNISPYLELVVDELLYLSNRTMYDSYQQAPFKVKVDILIFILDYPGIGKVMNVTGSGSYSGCVWCDIHGKPIITILHSSSLNHNLGEHWVSPTLY